MGNYIKIHSPLPLRYSQGNITLYHSYHGKSFRYNLLKCDASDFQQRTSSLRINPDRYDARYEVTRIEGLCRDVAAALIELEKTKTRTDTITRREVDALILKMKAPASEVSGREVSPVLKFRSFIDDFGDWIDGYRVQKSREDAARGIVRGMHPTVKDFISAKHLLEDFQHDRLKNKPFTLKDITNDFLDRVRDYAYEEHTDEPDKVTKSGKVVPQYKHKTVGRLRNKTINKRMDCIFQFLRDKYGALPNDVKKKPVLEVLDGDVIRLTRDELRTLENLVIRDEHKTPEYNYDYYRDVLLFLCYTGIRFGDFQKLNATYYHPVTNMLVFNANKTRKRCEVPLLDVALEIGKKYDFNFNAKYNQSINRGIKNFLKAYHLFEDEITIEYSGKGGRLTKKKLKRELISCHTGRRTFVSLLLDMGMSVMDVISATGHVVGSSSLKRYIDLFGNDRNDRFKALNARLTSF